jgi:predicted outer membrane repeat protein
MNEAALLDGLVIRGGNTREGGLGGGILAQRGRLVLRACSLVENRAWRGGAIFVEDGELHLFRCRLTENQTTGEGGAIFHATSSVEAHSCLFAANSAASDGGAIFGDLGNSEFLNCSFGDNHSSWRGGAIYSYVAVFTYAGNSIFWGNSDQAGSGENSQIFLNPTNILDIDYSCIQGWSGTFGGEGNFGDDPLLTDLYNGDLHLAADSPCIDSGNNELIGTQFDLDGNLRVINDRVDMGCYEFPGVTMVPSGGFDSVPITMLHQNHPNPFNPQTTIAFEIPKQEVVSLRVFDMAGRMVRSLITAEPQTPGRHEVVWNGRDDSGRQVASGTYFYRLEAGSYSETKRMVLIK